MLKCVLQYFDTFLFGTFWEFNSFHFSHYISYSSLHYNVTNIPLTLHMRVSSLKLYVYCITLYLSGQCFVPHNHILHRRCNIGTTAHLLLTKYPSYEFLEWFGKLINLLGFLQFHMVVIMIWNGLFGSIHTIWIWNSKTLLLLFYEFIFHHTSPIILLLFSCHLCCIYFSSFSNLITYPPPLHFASCWDVVNV